MNSAAQGIRAVSPAPARAIRRARPAGPEIPSSSAPAAVNDAGGLSRVSPTRAAALAAVLVSVVCACSESDDTGPVSPFQLARGQQSAPFQFDFLPGRTNELSFGQSCADSEEGLCCSLLLYDPDASAGDISNFSGLRDIILDPGSSTVRRVFDGVGGGSAAAVIYADSSCTAEPVMIRDFSTGPTAVSENIRGQLQLHNEVEVQSVGGRFYLRDISRRAVLGNGGRLASPASLEVIQLFDFDATLPLLTQDGLFLLKSNQVSYAPSGVGHQSVRRGVDALASTQIVHDFFLREFSLNSWDNRGGSMVSVIEAPFPTTDVVSTACGGQTSVIPKGSSYNAFYQTGSPFIFFTPIPEEFRDNISHTFSASLDVVAHEWGHAFLDRESMLVYARESGALNEAFADWTAVRIGYSANRGNWLIGDDLGFRAFRDLAAPRLVGDGMWRSTTAAGCPEPALCNDYCGVHDNNGVPNHMFYLLSDGGAATPPGRTAPVTVRGIGIDIAYRVAVEANKNYWTSNTDFTAARAGMEMAALMLYSSDQNIANQVGNAWAAVGVGEPGISAPLQ